MHDSRVGAFGAIAIVVALLLKWQLLVSVAESGGAMVLLACWWRRTAPAARWRSRSWPRMTTCVPRARQAGGAAPGWRRPGFRAGVRRLPLLWLSPLFAGVAILVLAVLRAALGAYFVRRIGGYTGDCLGMAQQLAELSIYLVAAAWKWS
jgi:adenosylcobinamide-GDP ribazoletransferase